MARALAVQRFSSFAPRTGGRARCIQKTVGMCSRGPRFERWKAFASVPSPELEVSSEQTTRGVGGICIGIGGKIARQQTRLTHPSVYALSQVAREQTSQVFRKPECGEIGTDTIGVPPSIEIPNNNPTQTHSHHSLSHTLHPHPLQSQQPLRTPRNPGLMPIIPSQNSKYAAARSAPALLPPHNANLRLPALPVEIDPELHGKYADHEADLGRCVLCAG